MQRYTVFRNYQNIFSRKPDIFNNNVEFQIIKILKKIIMATNQTNINARISEIRAYFCQNSNVIFANKLGISNSRASNLCNTEPNVGRQTIEKILTAFPQVSRAWLMLGDGYMLTEDNIKHNDPSLHLPSESNKDKMNTPAHTCEDYITIPIAAWTVIQQQAASLAAKDAILASQSSQIDRMLDLLEKKKQAPSLTTLLTSLETSEK